MSEVREGVVVVAPEKELGTPAHKDNEGTSVPGTLGN